ncbi:hypothetical protein EV363DRAFT_1449155 [Boletus edulis]|nr:hypothetical protein EV363DRAFT_1449155 [Boletus edulis]
MTIRLPPAVQTVNHVFPLNCTFLHKHVSLVNHIFLLNCMLLHKQVAPLNPTCHLNLVPQVQGQSQALLPPPASCSNTIVGDPVNKAEKSHCPGNEMVDIDYDLLKRHHFTNERRRPPSPTYLDGIHSNGTGKYKKARQEVPLNRHSASLEPQSLGNKTNDTTDGPPQNQPEERKGRWSVNPKGTKLVNPTTLAFFPPLWTKLLDFAKAHMRLYTTVENPFPSLANAIDGACQECLFETLAYYEDNNLELEAEMARLLYNDISTYQCEIKKLVMQNIPIHYRLCPPSSARTDAERYKSICNQAQALLDNWFFLRGEPDEQGKTSNFGHEGLKYVCLGLFYSNTSKSLRQFLDFHSYIPYNALALMAAFVQVVLGIFADYGYVPRNLKIDVNKLKDSYDKLQ